MSILPADGTLPPVFTALGDGKPLFYASSTNSEVGLAAIMPGGFSKLTIWVRLKNGNHFGKLMIQLAYQILGWPIFRTPFFP